MNGNQLDELLEALRRTRKNRAISVTFDVSDSGVTLKLDDDEDSSISGCHTPSEALGLMVDKEIWDLESRADHWLNEVDRLKTQAEGLKRLKEAAAPPSLGNQIPNS